MIQGAWGWYTGMTQRDGMGGMWEGGSGWGTHVHPWLIHVNVWQKTLQYCKVISLQFKKRSFFFFFKRILWKGWTFLVSVQVRAGYSTFENTKKQVKQTTIETIHHLSWLDLGFFNFAMVQKQYTFIGSHI